VAFVSLSLLTVAGAALALFNSPDFPFNPTLKGHPSRIILSDRLNHSNISCRFLLFLKKLIS
jgi:hypothetical protein